MLFKEKVISLVCIAGALYVAVMATGGLWNVQFQLYESINLYGLACILTGLALRPAMFFTDLKLLLTNDQAARPLVSRYAVNGINLIGMGLIFSSFFLRMSQ